MPKNDAAQEKKVKAAVRFLQTTTGVKVPQAMVLPCISDCPYLSQYWLYKHAAECKCIRNVMKKCNLVNSFSQNNIFVKIGWNTSLKWGTYLPYMSDYIYLRQYLMYKHAADYKYIRNK